MRFELSFGTTLSSPGDFVEVAVFGLAPDHIELIYPDKQADRRMAQTLEVADAVPLELRVEAKFRRSGEAASVGATVRQATGLHIQQVNHSLVLADIRHGVVETADQCTVRCIATGQSRTGRNVCIECGTPRGIIKICC